jgi:hypothetical protein
MFDISPSSQVTEVFRGVGDTGVVRAITRDARQQNAACARELAAIGELYVRRAPEHDTDRANWAVDGYENLVAEVSAALAISRGRARGRLRYAIELRERLPRVAEVFARGDIDFRLMAAVVYRTELVGDPVLVAKLDAAIAKHAHNWMRLSKPKLYERRAIRSGRPTDARPAQRGSLRRDRPDRLRAGRNLGAVARPGRCGVGPQARRAGRHGVPRRPPHQEAAPRRRVRRAGRRARRHCAANAGHRSARGPHDGRAPMW